MQRQKILVLQLARLGDIYQTWPVLRALKRLNPECDLHFLTRSTFSAAAPTDGVVDRLWALDTRAILAPLIDERPQIDESLARLTKMTNDLRATGFDRVINLSFSPFSSYLTREIAGAECDVRGYTRSDDGYLAIPDDGSAYFYAQVGPTKANRLHVTDLFAHVAGVELAIEDWAANETSAKLASVVLEAGEKAIVVHVGASQLGKTLSAAKWSQVIRGLCRVYEAGRVVVIGSAEEAELAEGICISSADRKALNLTGRTKLPELFEIIRNAACVIGGDSAPVHIATLTSTPVLNISLPQVSFWETGPKAPGSRIVRIDSEDDVAAEQLVEEVLRIVQGRAPALPVIRVPERNLSYVETRPQPKLFEWELLKAVYMGEDFPAVPNETFLVGIERMKDVNQLAIEQLEALRRVPANQTAAAILDRADEVMDQILTFVPELQPVVDWFRVERLRIGPMAVAQLVDATEALHQRFADILSLYGETPTGGAYDNVILE